MHPMRPMHPIRIVDVSLSLTADWTGVLAPTSEPVAAFVR